VDSTKKTARTIRKSCEALGTYKEEFEPIVLRLAELYERKQAAAEMFLKSGAHVIITQTNKSGAEYMTRNPFLTEIDSVQKMMLELEKELGLTPAALKRIKDEEFMKAVNDDPLSAAIKGLRVIRGA
jgi:P27 family predicted phage terminase small subunit